MPHGCMHVQEQFLAKVVTCQTRRSYFGLDKEVRNVKRGIVIRDRSSYPLFKIIFNNIYVLM